MMMGKGSFRPLAIAFMSLIGLSAIPASAQELFEGLYARSPELCKAAQADIETLFDSGETMLTAKGFEGIEYHCEFADIKGAPHAGWLATMLCEEPGYAFPDVVAIMPRGEGELEVSSLRSNNTDGAAGNGGMYYLCEGVTPP